MLRRSIRWRAAAPMLVGVAVGAPLGAYTLSYLPEALLERTLGAYLVGIALHGLLAPKPDPNREAARPPDALPFATGVASGGLGGTFNIGGPPLIAYVYRQPWTQIEMNATLQAVFLLSYALQLSAYLQAGLIGPDAGAPILAALPPVFAGAIAGRKLIPKVRQDRLQAAIYLALGLLGFHFFTIH
jgi:uncharacterized membrane protein YfcA